MTGESKRAIRVSRAGALTTVQDCGRPGYAHLGVPRSGALDAPAHHLANRLVGNPPAAPVLETTLTGVAISAECDVVAAVTGARAAVRVGGQPARLGAPIRLRRGQLLEVRSATSGVRSYLAFSGGLAVPRVLGSASADLLSGLGPPRLASGDVLQLGPIDETGGRNCCVLGELPAIAVPAGPASAPAGNSVPEPVRLVVHPGPRFDWLASPGLPVLEDGQWMVSPDSNRVALRLAGQPVRRRRGELASEGLVCGAIQALPDGHLVLFLADHPTTGGYPVIAVVDPACVSACAQARPGSKISFRLASGRT